MRKVHVVYTLTLYIKLNYRVIQAIRRDSLQAVPREATRRQVSGSRVAI
jgi:hypothetical protein